VAPPQAIAQFLAEVRGQLSRRERLAWLGRVGPIAALALLALVLASGLVSVATLRALFAAGLGACVVLSLRARSRTRARLASDDAVARHVGAAAPEVKLDLLSAVQLEREIAQGAEPLTSATLIGALSQLVAARLAPLAPAALVPIRRTRRRAAAGVLVSLAAYGAVSLIAPGALRRGFAALVLGRRPIQVSAEPIVGDLKLTLTYPSYTGLPPRVIPSSSGQILALPGTEVALEGRSLVSGVGFARLRVEREGQTPAELPVTVQGDALTAHLHVETPGTYRFELEARGRGLREPEAHRIDIDVDGPPRVDLVVPAETLELAGPRRVELLYSAEDDFGLGDIELVWRVDEAPERRKVIGAGAGARSAQGKLEWDTAELELKAGARVAYHVEAKDTDTVPRPNIGRSRTYYLTIFSPRQRAEQAERAEEELLELAIAALGDRLELSRADDDGLLDGIGRLRPRSEALVDAVARAAAAARGPESGRKETAQGLEAMAGRLDKLTREEETELKELRERRHQRGGRLKAGEAQKLATRNGKNIAELERDVLELDDLLGRQRLEELLRIGDEMAQARDRLRSLLEQYRKTRSAALKQEIERELKDLERKLAELERRAQRLASELPDQFLNPEAMGKNDLKSDLDQLRELLQKGDLDQLMARMDQLSGKLDRMLQSMEQDLKGYRNERFSEEEKELGELQNKLADLEHDEHAIKDETDELERRARKEAQRRLRDQVDPFVRRARERVARLKKQLDAVDRQALAAWNREELERAQKRVDDLDRMLDQGDLEEALAMARQAEGELKGMSEDLKQEDSRALAGLSPTQRKARERVGEGETIARELADELDKMIPKPSELATPEERKQLSDLAGRQQATQKRLEELRRMLAKGASGRPQVDGALKDAGHHMGEAEERLSRRSPRDASPKEGQALEKLSQAKQQLENERRPRDTQMGPNNSKEPVKIPGADEYKAPRQFRQDLLEAMKRGAPGEYKEQVKRYYEELVK
jgi:hypothetical protein